MIPIPCSLTLMMLTDLLQIIFVGFVSLRMAEENVGFQFTWLYRSAQISFGVISICIIYCFSCFSNLKKKISHIDHRYKIESDLCITLKYQLGKSFYCKLFCLFLIKYLATASFIALLIIIFFQIEK